MNLANPPVESQDAASQGVSLPVLPLLLPHITIALILFTACYGLPLIRLALSPGQGWYQWVLDCGVAAFFAMIAWLWYRTISAFIQNRKQQSLGENSKLSSRQAASAPRPTTLVMDGFGDNHTDRK